MPVCRTFAARFKNILYAGYSIYCSCLLLETCMHWERRGHLSPIRVSAWGGGQPPPSMLSHFAGRNRNLRLFFLSSPLSSNLPNLTSPTSPASPSLEQSFRKTALRIMPYLTEEQKQRWKEDGYLVLPSFFTDEETKDMLNEAKRLCGEFDIEGHPMVCAVDSYLLSFRQIDSTIDDI